MKNYLELYKKYKYKYVSLKRQLGGEFRKIHVSEPWFTFIKEGKKTVEGRLNKGQFAELHVNDIVIWFNKDSTEEIKTRIIEINLYPSFRNMLEKERLENVLPSKTSLDDGEKVYYQYYSPEDEKKFGVLAIKLQLILV